MTFVLFLALLLFNFADQALLSPLLNPLLQDFFGNTVRVLPLGWLSFVVTILMAMSMLSSGILADRITRKKIAFVGCLVYGLASMLVLFTPSGRSGYAFFFAVRCLNGLGIGTLVPALFSMVGDTVDPRRRGTAFGAVSVAMLLGRLAGFAAAGAWTGHWRTAYFVVGLVNLILGFGLLLVHEPRRGAQEKELKDIILHGAEYRFRFKAGDVRLLWANRSNFWLTLNFIGVVPGAIIAFLIFKYTKDVHNMAAGTVNLAILLVFVAGGLGAMLFGRLGDWGSRRDERAKVLVAFVCNAVPIAFMIVFLRARFWVPEGASVSQTLAVPGVWPFIAAIVVAMFINQGVNPNWYSTLTEVNLPEHRATMISLISLLDMAGNALGPLVASLAVGVWGMRAAMATSLVFWVVNIFLWLPLFRTVRRDLGRRHGILTERAHELQGR